MTRDDRPHYFSQHDTRDCLDSQATSRANRKLGTPRIPLNCGAFISAQNPYAQARPM